MNHVIPIISVTCLPHKTIIPTDNAYYRLRQVLNYG